MSGVVYFVRPVGERGPIKIGHSQSPERRLHHLMCWSPIKLEIAARIAGDDGMERQFHAMFKADYSHKEWFGWSQSMQDVIDAINGGTFDVSVLPESEWITLRDRPRSKIVGPHRRLVKLPDGSIGFVGAQA